MKNTFKKFAGIAAASIMAASMVAPMAMNFTASAVDITIKEGESTSESTFWGFQLMTATDGGAGKFSYTVNSKYSSILQTALGVTTDAEVITEIGKIQNQSEAMRTFADKVYLAIKAEGLSQDATSTDGVISGTQGYYLIAEKALDANDTDGTMSLVMVDTLGNDALEVTVKKEAPSFQKKLKDINDTDDADITDNAWVDSADHDYNNAVPFQLTATLPADYAKYQQYKLVFHDNLRDADGKAVFDNVADIKVYYDANNDNVIDEGEEITAFTTNNAPSDNYCDFEVTIANLKTANANAAAGGLVKVEYTATLTEDAVLGSAGNWNEAYLEYSNNPYYNGEGGETETTSETPKDQVVVFTYKTVINKIDGTEGANKGQALAGAKFTLHKMNAAGTYDVVESFTAGTETTFEFKGLDDGTYKLVEDEAPKGYNKIADIEFKIEATHTEGETPALDTLTGTKVTGEITLTADKTAGSLTADVENKSGTELPSTGGIGTTLFYLGGGAMVAVAGVYLISKKRMKNED